MRKKIPISSDGIGISFLHNPFFFGNIIVFSLFSVPPPGGLLKSLEFILEMP